MYKRKLPDGFLNPRLCLTSKDLKKFDFYLFHYITKCTIFFSYTKLLTITTIVMFTITLCPAPKTTSRPDKYPETRSIIPKLKKQKSKNSFCHRVPFLVVSLSWIRSDNVELQNFERKID